MFKVLATTVAMAILCLGCSVVYDRLGIQDDFLGEEILEELIEAKTGLDIDLTPRSPEKP